MNSDDLNACADLVRRADPERFMAAMAAPVAARRVLFPIYAFNAEVARAPWVTAEPIIAEMRLQWWRDVLEEIRAGGSVRRHEVATPLAEVLDEEATRLLDELILARRWDIFREAHENEAAFDAYLTATAGHLMWTAARALGASEECAETVLQAGYAHGLVNLMHAIPALESAGRIPLVDGRGDAVQTLAAKGLDQLSKARAARSGFTVSARPALLPLWKTRAVLHRVQSNPAHVVEGTLDVSPLGSRLRLMWCAATGRW